MDLLLARQPAPAHNLPVRLTSFVGRERERADLIELLAERRLVTLVGAPGVGKTRLALRVAEELACGRPGGVWLVELAPLTEAALVPRGVATALGIHEQTDQPLASTLGDALRARELLLVLDNCEHLIEACATLSEELLRACPRLRILATSREPLRIEGEALFRVPSLSTPDPSPAPEGSDGVARLMGYESVRLFADRARAALSTFALTGRGALAVATICRRLDGIPLAIELAAARVGGLSPTQIAARLDDSFRLLTGGRRTALLRQQTLRALIDWSHDLLPEPERVLLRRLSVFAGGWNAEAAEAVCAGDGLHGENVLDLLLHLVDKSLVLAEDHAGESRYRLLETIRQYADEKLREAGEESGARQRHADWCLQLAEEAAPRLLGAEQGPWLDRLESEHDNFRVALLWSIERGDGELGLLLGAGLSQFWEIRGYHTEGRARLTQVLRLARTRAFPWARANVLCELGFLAVDQVDQELARACLEESLVIMRDLGDGRGAARSLAGLAWLAINVGDFSPGRALLEESLAMMRELGDQRGVADALTGLGYVETAQSDHAAARACHEESLHLMRALDDRRNIARSLAHLGWVAIDQRDHAGSRGLLVESLAIARELGDSQVVLYGLDTSAYLALTVGRPDRAAQLHGAAEALRESIGVPLCPSERALFAGSLAAARSSLGGEAYAAGWAEGRALSSEQAVELALALLEPASPTICAPNPKPCGDSGLPLTARQREVAALVARGLSNRDIAARLVVSERTVHGHVASILSRLDFRSRSQVAVWAVQHGLTASPEL